MLYQNNMQVYIGNLLPFAHIMSQLHFTAASDLASCEDNHPQKDEPFHSANSFANPGGTAPKVLYHSTSNLLLSSSPTCTWKDLKASSTDSFTWSGPEFSLLSFTKDCLRYTFQPPNIFCKHYREIIWGMEIKEHHIETESNVLFTLMVEPELKSPYIFETTWSHNSVSFSYIPSYLLPASDRHSPLPFPPISPPMAEDDLLLNSFHHSCDMEIPHSSCCITPSQHSNCSPNSAKMQGKKKKKVKICIKDNCSKFAMSVCRASTFVKQRMKDPWSGLVSDGEIIAVPASKCRVKDKSQNDCDEISFSQICKVLLLWRCSQKAAQCIRLYSALM